MGILNSVMQSAFGESYEWIEEENGQENLQACGVWYAEYLLTPFGFLEQGPKLALGIVPPDDEGKWPVWLVYANGSIQIISRDITELIPGLLVNLALEDSSFCEELQRQWGDFRKTLLEAHLSLGGREALFHRFEKALLTDSDEPNHSLQLLEARTDDPSHQQALRVFQLLQAGPLEVNADLLLPPDSVWATPVNSCVLAAWDDQDQPSELFVATAMQLVRSPNAVGMAKSRDLVERVDSRSAWMRLMETLRAWRHQHPEWFTDEKYAVLIEPMADFGYTGLQHFELAAGEEETRNDPLTAYALLCSASFWWQTSHGGLLPEAPQMAAALAEKYHWEDVLAALSD